MPVSSSVHITHCVQYIMQLDPKSVLDIGCGFGLWGFLCREYLDVYNGRILPQQWQTRIDGVELFAPYIQEHQRVLYTSIRIADIRDIAQSLDQYDLVIAGDIIEHFDKDEAEELLFVLHGKADKALMVNIPIGPGWEHPEAYGNPGELHRSQWEPEDFLPYCPNYNLFELPCGQYGVFWCDKAAPIAERVAGFVVRAQRYEKTGDTGQAIANLHRGLSLDPTHREATLLFADLLIKLGQLDDATSALARAIEHSPTFHFAYLMLAKLLEATGRNEEAMSYLQSLLNTEGVEEDQVQAAKTLMQRLET